MRRALDDVTRSVAWQIADVQLLRQIAEDLDTLAEAGVGDLDSTIRSLRRQVWEGKLNAAEWGRDQFLNPAVVLATKLGFDERLAISMFAWRKYRAPLVRLSRIVRDEADRLRAADGRPEVRRG